MSLLMPKILVISSSYKVWPSQCCNRYSVRPIVGVTLIGTTCKITIAIMISGIWSRVIVQTMTPMKSLTCGMGQPLGIIPKSRKDENEITDSLKHK